MKMNNSILNLFINDKKEENEKDKIDDYEEYNFEEEDLEEDDYYFEDEE